MKKSSLLIYAAVIVSSSLSHAVLHDRGNGMIYDDVLNITWLADSNYANSSGYSVTNERGDKHIDIDNIVADGRMGWVAANEWVSNLNYAGYSDWRLPSAKLRSGKNIYANDGTGDKGYNVTNSELGYMFYVNLNNKGKVNSDGSLNTSYNGYNSIYTFSNGQTVNFGIGYQPFWFKETTENKAWVLNITGGTDGSDFGGLQGTNFQGYSRYAWAVRDGDVSEVPVPAAAWLFASGLLLLASKRK